MTTARTSVKMKPSNKNTRIMNRAWPTSTIMDHDVPRVDASVGREPLFLQVQQSLHTNSEAKQQDKTSYLTALELQFLSVENSQTRMTASVLNQNLNT